MSKRFLVVLVAVLAASCGDDPVGGGDASVVGDDQGDDLALDGPPIGDTGDDTAVDSAADPDAEEADEDGVDDGLEDDIDDNADALTDLTTDGVTADSDLAGLDVEDVEPDLPPGVCGDGELTATEQCDDGNTVLLDGCDADCNYEMAVVFTSLRMAAGQEDFCGHPNELGAAFGSLARGVLTSTLDDAIAAGELNLLLAFPGLDDPTGQTDEGLSLGIVTAVPDLRDIGPGTIAQRDSWYTDAMPVDEAGSFGLVAPAEVTDQVFTTTEPVDMSFDALGGSLDIRQARLRAPIGNAAPQAPTPPPPGEVVDPDLTTFVSLNAIESPTGQRWGICGEVTVATLDLIPIPAELAVGGSSACNPACTDSLAFDPCDEVGEVPGLSCSSLLDLVVGGCVINFISECSIVLVDADNLPSIGPDEVTDPVVIPLDGSDAQPTQPDAAYTVRFNFNATRAHITNHVTE